MASSLTSAPRSKRIYTAEELAEFAVVEAKYQAGVRERALKMKTIDDDEAKLAPLVQTFLNSFPSTEARKLYLVHITGVSSDKPISVPEFLNLFYYSQRQPANASGAVCPPHPPITWTLTPALLSHYAALYEDTGSDSD
jgi:hypothetical protein